MGNKRVLIIDGDTPSRERLRRQFSGQGWSVALAATVASGSILLSHLTVPAGQLWEALRELDVDGLIAVLDSITPAGEEFYWQGFAVMLLAALLLGVRCSGAVTGERERQTWEALLLTPLETRTIDH